MKVLYLANPLRSGTGGDRRSFEVLKRIGLFGVESIIVVDDFLWQKMKSDGSAKNLRNKIYSVKRPNVIYNRHFRSASRIALEYFSIVKTARIIAEIAKKEKVDLIVSHHEKVDFLLEAYLAAKKCSIPWTCIFQSYVFPPYASTPWKRINLIRRIYLLALYVPLYSFVIKAIKTATVLAVSSSIEVDIKHYFGGWKSKMMILKPGVGVDQKRMQLEKPMTDVDAVFFSRLVPEKGLYDLPKIAADIVRMKPDFKFFVVGMFGTPVFRQRFDKLVSEYQVGNNLIYKGFYEWEALFSLVKSAKVLVYPSQQDAFPLVVLEALAAGLPVVAYDVPAIRLNFTSDVVWRVPTSNYKAMADATLQLSGDPQLREAVSMKALAFASLFTWDRATEEEAKAYSKILNSSMPK